MKKLKLRVEAIGLLCRTTATESQEITRLLGNIVGSIQLTSKDTFNFLLYQGYVSLTPDQRNAIRTVIGPENVPEFEKAKSYNKAVLNGILFTHRGVGAATRRKDCYIKDSSNRFHVID